jgi:hypothetical protein
VQLPITAAIWATPLRAHRGLVEEDPAEVVAVREDLVLPRQERTAGVDQVDAGQPVLQRDLLGSQVLLDGHRVIGAALDRRVVGDHDAQPPGYPADAGDDARPGAWPSYIPCAASGRQFEETAARIEQRVDPVPGQQLASVAAAGVSGPAIYRHFPNKESLLVELLVGISTRLLDGARGVRSRQDRRCRGAGRLDRLSPRLRAG